MTNFRLHPVALGLALGIIIGVVVLVMGLITYFYTSGRPLVTTAGVLYIGFAPSIGGIILNTIMGFIDAFIAGVILAWLYNGFARCCTKKAGLCKPAEGNIEEKPEEKSDTQ